MIIRWADGVLAMSPSTVPARWPLAPAPTTVPGGSRRRPETCASLAAYARTSAATVGRPGERRAPWALDRDRLRGRRVRGDEGTPADWLFLAMAEHHLGHPEVARARLDQAMRWLDQARRDPMHPSVLGAFSDPSARRLARMAADGPMRPELPPSLRGLDPARLFLPNWRQMLTVEILRREAASLIGDPRGRGTARERLRAVGFHRHFAGPARRLTTEAGFL